LRRFLPILTWLPGYKAAWLREDGVAAISVWALLVPQGLAYATLAGVPVQYGLYTAFAALIAYAVFGTARQVVQGPSATVAAVSAAVITPLAGAGALGSDQAAEWSAALAIAAGLIYVVLGFARMGWISNFLSKAVLGGFILGFALGIVFQQLAELLGVDGGDGSYAEQLIQTLGELGKTNLTTLAVGAGSLALLLGMRYARPRWPRALVVVILATAITAALDLGAEGVAITGDVPTGLFSIGVPSVGWEQAGTLALGALSVIFVGYSETLAAARTVAAKHDYEIDNDQELVAQGFANGASGLVGGFVNDGSLSKSSVADATGQRTQMAALLNALLVLLTMLFLAALFENLPSAALGAVVIDAMVGLISFAAIRRYRRVNRFDFAFFCGAMLGILFFGVITGIAIGVVLSLLLLIARASTPALHRLGLHPPTGAYLDLARHDDLEPTPGIVIVRLDGPLFFADANRFRDGLERIAAGEAEPVRAVVFDAEAVSQTDTDGADVLIELAQRYADRGIEFALARVQSAVLEMWTRAGVLEALGEGRVFHTVEDAAVTFGDATAGRQRQG